MVTIFRIDNRNGQEKMRLNLLAYGVTLKADVAQSLGVIDAQENLSYRVLNANVAFDLLSNGDGLYFAGQDLNEPDKMFWFGKVVFKKEGRTIKSVELTELFVSDLSDIVRALNRIGMVLRETFSLLPKVKVITHRVPYYLHPERFAINV